MEEVSNHKDFGKQYSNFSIKVQEKYDLYIKSDYLFNIYAYIEILESDFKGDDDINIILITSSYSFPRDCSEMFNDDPLFKFYRDPYQDFCEEKIEIPKIVSEIEIKYVNKMKSL